MLKVGIKENDADQNLDLYNESGKISNPIDERTFRFQRIERKALANYNKEDTKILKNYQVVEIDDQSSSMNRLLAQKEKLKGNFRININKKLPFKKKIQMLANDPEAFYLHKNQRFFKKLEVSYAEKKEE